VPFGTRALQARALGRTTLPLRAEYVANYTRTMRNDKQQDQKALARVITGEDRWKGATA
jgi:hypothetical protein